jgi:thioredoxin
MKEILNDSEFAELYMSSEIPIVLDFYTETCNPCKSLMPIMDRLAFEYKNKVLFVKTKANENITLAKQLGVNSVPTLIFVDQGKNIERAKGIITEKALREKIESII